MGRRSSASFSQSFDRIFEGGTMQVTASGTFDEGGGLTGSIGVAPFNVERDGKSQL